MRVPGRPTASGVFATVKCQLCIVLFSFWLASVGNPLPAQENLYFLYMFEINHVLVD